MPKHTKKLTKEEEFKYKALIKYIISLYEGIGKVQLAKLIFAVDTDFYKKYKKTFSGDDYIKNRYGPTPCNLETKLSELEKEKEIIKEIEKNIDYSTHKLYIKKEKDSASLKKLFHPEGIMSIRQHGNCIISTTARQLSHNTHQSIYHALELGEHIPGFMLPHYQDAHFTPEDIEKQKEIMKKNEV